MRHGPRFPKLVVEASSLEKFKAKLDGAPSKMALSKKALLQKSLLPAGGWTG